MKQLTIAAMFLGTGALLGCGVSIAQLWKRSQLAETQASDLESELNETKETSQALQVQVRDVRRSRGKLELDHDRVIQERDQAWQDAEELRTKVARLQAQNEELEKAAQRAVQLSEQVAELQHRLGNEEGSEQLTAATKDTLVRVRKPLVPAAPLPQVDDGGWKSVADSQ